VHEETGASGAAFELITRRRLLLLGVGASLVPLAQGCSGQHEKKPELGGSGVAPSPALSSATPLAPPTESRSPAAPVPTRPTALLCREAWGASPIRPGGRAHTLNRMTLHHSAVLFDDNRQIASRLREHQRNHQQGQGWIDIAYHVAVDRKGNLFELRPAELVGDTATNYDPTGHFLVLVEGNFEEQQATDEQLQGAALAFAWAAEKYGISTQTLVGHRDVPAATACPGESLEAYITNGQLRERTDAILAEGPVPVQQMCGPEAAAIVAGIEAGR
jgi:hypothetical protein